MQESDVTGLCLEKVEFSFWPVHLGCCKNGRNQSREDQLGIVQARGDLQNPSSKARFKSSTPKRVQAGS